MRWWFSAILLLSFLPSCDRRHAASSRPGELPELRLGYFANVTHAQAILEVASGDLQSALGQTQLHTMLFNAGPSLIEALNAGAIDIGYVGPGPAIAGFINSQGQALRVIAGSAANGVVIVARPGSGITRLSDLKGKKIATPQLGNTQDVSARHYVTAVLGESTPDNVLPVPNSQQAGMMARGEIDAAWDPEPWAARLVSQVGATVVAQEKDLWPDKRFALTVIITTPQFLAAHPDVVAKVLRVHHLWTRRLIENPSKYQDQLDDALQDLTGKKLGAVVMTASLQHTRFTEDPIPSTFKTMARWSYDLGFVKSDPDLSALFDLDIIRRVDAAGAATQP